MYQCVGRRLLFTREDLVYINIRISVNLFPPHQKMYCPKNNVVKGNDSVPQPSTKSIFNNAHITLQAGRC